MQATIDELRAGCQKPQWREVGSWLARRFARPAAVYLTWLAVRGRVSPNAVTALTFMAGLGAAALLALPTAWGFVAGAAMLHFWYLLDHVDGQVARYRNAESVTGIYFDYMMHHIVHPACAFTLGYGLAGRTGELVWSLAGALFAIGLVIQAVGNDCLYKALYAVSRRGRIFGPRTGAACMPSTDGAICRRETRGLMRLANIVHVALCKACEIPNVIIVLSVLAGTTLYDGAFAFRLVECYVLAMALIAPAIGLIRLAKQVWLRLPDAAFQSSESS